VSRPRRVVAIELVLVVLLLVATVVLLALGVETVPTTADLLVDPFPTTRLVGTWLALAAVTGTAAVVLAIDAGVRARRAARPADV